MSNYAEVLLFAYWTVKAFVDFTIMSWKLRKDDKIFRRLIFFLTAEIYIMVF